MGQTMEHPRKALPEVAGFQAFRRGRIWGFANNLRYDSEQALLKMNELYRGDLRLLQNLFLPSVKLVAKKRVGSRLHRSYDPPKTPLDRLLDSPGRLSLRLSALRALRNRLDPFVLSSRLDAKLRRVHALSNSRYNPRGREKAS